MQKIYFWLILSAGLLCTAAAAFSKQGIALQELGGGHFLVNQRLDSIYSEDQKIKLSLASSVYFNKQAERCTNISQKPSGFFGFTTVCLIDTNTFLLVGKTIKKLPARRGQLKIPNSAGKMVFFILLAFIIFIAIGYELKIPLFEEQIWKEHSEFFNQSTVIFDWLAIAGLIYAILVCNTGVLRHPVEFKGLTLALIELSALSYAALLMLNKKFYASLAFYRGHQAIFWIIFFAALVAAKITLFPCLLPSLLVILAGAATIYLKYFCKRHGRIKQIPA